jgi:adenine-specific DNA-methyltransferase
MARKPANKSLEVDSLKHHDKRKNIPTEDLRDFVREEEQKPKEVKLPGLLYALDPQLVWKGKDEQARQELTVPAPRWIGAGISTATPS